MSNYYDEDDTQDDYAASPIEPLVDADEEEAADEAEAEGAFDTRFDDDNDNDDLDPDVVPNYRASVTDASHYDDDDNNRSLSSIPLGVNPLGSYTSTSDSTVYASTQRGAVDIDAVGGDLGELGHIIRQALVLDGGPRRVDDDLDDELDDPEYEDVDEEDAEDPVLEGGRDV